MATSHTVELLANAYIGGPGSLWGGTMAVFLFIFRSAWMRSTFTNLPGLHLVLYGLLLILIIVFYPGGLAQAYREICLAVENGSGSHRSPSRWLSVIPVVWIRTGHCFQANLF